MSSKFPLHALVWRNKVDELKKLLNQENKDTELKDLHDRTPLMLAVTLGHKSCVSALMEHGADVHAKCEGWTLTQEAVACNSIDREMIELVMAARDKVRHEDMIRAIPNMLKNLTQSPDFYIEMEVKFSSWLPGISSFCPSDTLRIYKRGVNVRVDSTLADFDMDRMSWKSGNITFLFTLTERRPQICLIDQTGKRVYKGELSSSAFCSASVLDVDARMTLPSVKISENVSCTRSKRFLGLGPGKNEMVNGRNCKLFDSNMEIITDVRMEHLDQADKDSWNRCQAWLTSKKESKRSEEKTMELQEYLTGDSGVRSNTEEAHTFQGKHQEKRSKTFVAQLWVCEDYPLSLQEQVMPILDLLSNLPCYGSVVGKIKNLISHELPEGFPVKINLPLYLSITAKINFRNVQSLENGVEGVSVKRENCSISVEMADSVFQIPPGYHTAQNLADVYESIRKSGENGAGQESRKRKRDVLANQIQKLKG